jgi:hypothetical protein
MNNILIQEINQRLREPLATRKLINAIKALAEEENIPDLLDRINDVDFDYQRMLFYMKEGYSDPTRQALYMSLFYKASKLALNLLLRMKIKTISSFMNASSRVSNANLGQDQIQKILEDYVADQAMLSLESEETRQQKAQEIYEKHQRQISQIFDYLFISPQWSDDDVMFYTILLLSPTIDITDALTLVSAISLAASQTFDILKQKFLAELFLKAKDERLRQRALVGWAFSLDSSLEAFKETEVEIANGMTSNEDNCREMVELQKQMIYCSNSKADNDKIQNEIMGNLMKNPNLKFTKFGIEEKEDKLNEILHPDASDKAMDEMEKTMQQLADMQNAGADIYFGGFSHMKRYPFFYDLSNWFVPFYLEHPSLNRVNEKLKGMSFLQKLMEHGPFCDSDKYSFALAMATTVDMMPVEIREMMNNEDALWGPAPVSDTSSPTYIRRMYLQDFYRFFNLYNDKNDFRNSFLDNGRDTKIFFCYDILKDTKLQKYTLEFISFLRKRNKDFTKSIQTLLANYQDKNDKKYLLAEGNLLLENGNMNANIPFEQVLASDPENTAALKAMAKYELIYGKASKAVDIYDKLVVIFPDKKIYKINKAIAQIKAEDYEEAVNELYRLNLEDATDQNVIRALAWGLLNKGNADQAYDEYNKLLLSGHSILEDSLNEGYASWFRGVPREACLFFGRYSNVDYDRENAPGRLWKAFNDDKALLLKHGISEIDMQLMIDMSIE